MPHLDLCRPFAAHCIGYPVVTLGFGFKSYIGYRIRQRKQKEVAKENEFYMQLLQQALPQDEITDKSQESIEAVDTLQQQHVTTSSSPAVSTNSSNNNVQHCKNAQNHHHKVHPVNGAIENGGTTVNGSAGKHYKKDKENGCVATSVIDTSQETVPNNTVLSKPTSKSNNLNFNNLQSSVKNTNTTSYQQIQNGFASTIKDLNVQTKCSPYKNKDDHNIMGSSTSNKKEYEKEKIIKDPNVEESVEPTSHKRKDKQQKDYQQYHQQHQPQTTTAATANTHHTNDKIKVPPCDLCHKLEQEAKRLKAELQNLKSQEHDTRQKLETIKGSLQLKQKEFEDAQKLYVD